VKVLYVSSNGGIHDYRFLKKLSGDFDVLFLHYASGEIITEIDKLDNLEIISKKPAFKSFPLASELWHFKKIIKEFQPDIIHSGYVWQVGILPAMAGFHPHLSMPWGSDILIEPDNSFIIKRLVKKVMKQCGHIQCDAEFVKKKIINDYNIPGDKITVFPWGIDLRLFKKTDKAEARKKLNIEENKFVIVFNRHFEPVYGIKDLMEGFNIFSKGKNDVLMLMLSEGSQKNDALKFITENKLEDKINLIGRVANTELPAVLNASDVYISTSLSDGSSLSLLEAMACGLGLVVTDVPAIKEWVSGENGMVVPRKSPADIAKALESYYQNRQLLGSHGIKNIEIASLRCDWDQNYLKLKEIYSRLING
jgi:L-malate glycosyltransferase